MGTPPILSLPRGHCTFKAESKAKVTAGQAQIVGWDNIKDNPPPQLKVSPIAAIPHKSKDFQSILNLYFQLRLKNGGFLNSVNETTIKSALKGALDQLGFSGMPSAVSSTHSWRQMMMQKNFMAKWDIRTASGAWIAR